jgi:hypothetical protein
MQDATPAPTEVGRRAADILTLIKNSEEFARLESSSQAYTDCWATFTGYPLVAKWNLQKDTPRLFEEALRVLALKTAVFELTDGNEEVAELEISAPVGNRRGGRRPRQGRLTVPDWCCRASSTVSTRRMAFTTSRSSKRSPASVSAAASAW